MELKFVSRASNVTDVNGSNRTFMELKLYKLVTLTQQLARSNRTFMELKFESPLSLSFIEKVLIVPLWN